MSSTEVRQVGKLVAEVMEELHIVRTPVYVRFTDSSARAGATRQRYPGAPLHVKISTRRAIKRLMPELTDEEVRAKQVSQVAEEFSHFVEHEDCHTEYVVDTTVKVMKRHMSKRAFETPFIQDKIQNLREVSRSSDLACG